MLNTTAVPANGSTAQPVKTFLCPSRRTTVVGAKTDYATAMQNGMFLPAIGTTAAGHHNSILGSALTTLRAATRGIPAQGTSFGGTTMGAVTSADGTANTVVLSHKAMNPSSYTNTASQLGDTLWADEQVNANSMSDHNRLIIDYTQGTYSATAAPPSGIVYMAPIQDANTTGLTATTSPSVQQTQLGFGSPHPGAMPTLYGDGSVRNFAYTSSGSASGLTLTTGMVWAALWSFNDGLALSGVN